MSHQIGDILGGKYALEASIGRGGMGEVFSASHLGSGRKVAVKVVNRAILGDMLMVRLHREAVAAGRIKSDFVPQVLDVDRTEEGELFLVMELLHGESLSQRLKKRNGSLTWEETRQLGEDVLRGLIDAHAAGVIHRDLKPGNIFLETHTASGARERGKVLDFGVCKLDAQDVEHLTTTGEALGTIAYMAPEQIRGASKVDERADIYSFAVVVFEALSGRLPYDASGAMAMIACKLERTAKTLKECALVPIPAGLDALIARALARKPADRTSSVQEVLKAWRALGAATQVPRASASASALPVAFHTQTAMTAGPATRAASARTSRVGIAVAAIALGASSILLVFVLFARRAPAAQAPVAIPTVAAAVAALPIGTSLQGEDGPGAAPADTGAPQTLPSIDLPDVAPAKDAGVSRAPSRARPASRPSAPVPAPRKSSGSPRIIGEPRY